MSPEQRLAETFTAEWGRLLAILIAGFRRIDLAEDSLADAFEAAARRWPVDGVPDSPPSWLLTAARRRILDRLRAEAVAVRRMPMLAVETAVQQNAHEALTHETVRDERLRLVLLCAHPALAPESAAALTLRLVMGVSTDEIAKLFLVSTPTMAARLTRARKRISSERFGVPEGPELDDRVEVVANVAYLAFTAGYAPGSGPDVVRAEIAAEAIRLARVLREVLPGRSELDALLALMLLQHARRAARVRDGHLVLLPDQDRSRWEFREIGEALDLLTPHASAPAAPYLLQALIAAEHSIAHRPQDTDWPRIVQWYDELLSLAESDVVRLNRAVAVAEADGPLAGLRALEGLSVPGHRLPAARAEFLHRAGQLGDAISAYDEALAACEHDAERDHLNRRRTAAVDG